MRVVPCGLVLIRVGSRYTRYTRRIEVSAYIPGIRIRRVRLGGRRAPTCLSMPREDRRFFFLFFSFSGEEIDLADGADRRDLPENSIFSLNPHANRISPPGFSHEGEEGFTGCLERLARAYTCVRTWTRDDRYDNSRIDALTHCHCQKKTESDRRVSERMRAGWSLLSAARALSLRSSVVRSRGSPDAYEREKRAPPVARKRVTEIVYISFNLYHRAISPSALYSPPPLSPPFVSPRSLFFLALLSLLIFPGSLSGQSLPFGDRYRARARARDGIS